MKRLWAGIVAAAIMMLCGCSPLIEENDTIELYASFYPIYALLDRMIEDVPDMQLHCLVQPQDGCLRSYEISDWDLRLLDSSADAIIIGGRGLESFESILFGWGNNGPAVSAVLYNLELYNQENENQNDEEASHLVGANPHLYMSVDGAKSMIESMEASLIALDPQYVHIYSENVLEALDSLDKLKSDMLEIAGDISGSKVILMNEALVYVARDYGLDIDMCYDRESGVALYDSELSQCLAKLEKSSAQVVLIERQVPDGFVTALENAGYTVAQIDILSDRTASDGFDGYLQAQRENAAAIRSAFKKLN